MFLSCREMDKQKSNLLDAYVRKVIALGKINLTESKQAEIDSTKKPTAVADDIDAIYTELGKFTDYNDQKVNRIYIALEQVLIFNTFYPFVGDYFVIVARI